MKRILITMTALLLVLLGSTSILAADITLTWDPASSSNVAGYKFYYKVGTSSLYNGTGILEGDSPIDVGDNLSMGLTGLQDNTLYTFTVTSYDVNGLESNFAGSIAWTSNDPSPYIPALVYPPNQANELPTSVVFSWSAPADGRDVAYTLTFGTDPNLQDPQIAYSTSNGKTPAQPMNPVPLYAATGLLGLALRKRLQKRGLLVAALVVTGLILCGCGGGGSGSDVAGPATGDGSVAPAEVFTSAIPDISQNSFEIYDFEPGTTYYWKIVADDGVTVTESGVQSFVTAEQ